MSKVRRKAFLDATVLAQIPVADTLLRCAEAELFQPLWSQLVLEELAHELGRAWRDPRHEGLPARRSTAMQHAFPEALVSGWEALLSDSLKGPASTNHVLAAAVISGADVIVSCAPRTYPRDDQGQHVRPVADPDQFLQELLEADPNGCMGALVRQASATGTGVMPVPDLLEVLYSAGVPGFADLALRHLWRCDLPS